MGNDIEDLYLFSNYVPIPDQIKYLFCSKVSEDEESNAKKNKISTLKHPSIKLSFYPLFYVQEIISFYRYFPLYKHDEKLKSQLKVPETL
jgi:hypothetical protein